MWGKQCILEGNLKSHKEDSVSGSRRMPSQSYDGIQIHSEWTQILTQTLMFHIFSFKFKNKKQKNNGFHSKLVLGEDNCQVLFQH